MPARLNHIAPVFAVSDLRAAIDWYSRALRMSASFINRDDGDQTGESWSYALLDGGGVEIHLARIVAEDATLNSPSNCYLFVEEIDRLHKQLSEVGADVSPLTDMPWGSRECWLHDPDGNRLVLSEPG